MTKFISPNLFLLLSLLLSLFVNLGSARLGPEDYWNKYVRDQYIPEAIKDMFRQEPDAISDLGNDVNKRQEGFLRNFDTRRFDAVVYHTHNSHRSTGNSEPSVRRLDKFKEE